MSHPNFSSDLKTKKCLCGFFLANHFLKSHQFAEASNCISMARETTQDLDFEESKTALKHKLE